MVYLHVRFLCATSPKVSLSWLLKNHLWCTQSKWDFLLGSMVSRIKFKIALRSWKCKCDLIKIMKQILLIFLYWRFPTFTVLLLACLAFMLRIAIYYKIYSFCGVFQKIFTVCTLNLCTVYWGMSAYYSRWGR